LKSPFKVFYSYTLPNNAEATNIVSTYNWRYDKDWSACSKACGKGKFLQQKCHI